MPMIDHKPQGDPCIKCGESGSRHRRTRSRSAYRKAYRLAHLDEEKTRDHGRIRKRKCRYVGVDGEGYNLPDGSHVPACDDDSCRGCAHHRYVYLAAVDSDGDTISETEFKPAGLSHEDCVQMILSLNRHDRNFWFMGGYDVTKIIEELDEADRYMLMRPEARARKQCKKCGRSRLMHVLACPKCKTIPYVDRRNYVYHKNRGYDYFGGFLRITDLGEKSGPKKKRHSIRVWDSFKFFGCSFVKALKGWSIGNEEQRARIAEMKAKRGSFENEDPKEIMKYCREECQLLAEMMKEVVAAHDEAGIRLRDFYGAGSTASAVLKASGTAAHRGPPLSLLDPGLALAIRSAYFGGRFEGSRIGIFRMPVNNYDISSAYPYAQATECPCLAHGKWTRITGSHTQLLKRIKRADLALCRFKVKRIANEERRELAWAPLPFRGKDGSICYPTNFHGWGWAQEVVPAIEGWGKLVRLHEEAWIFARTAKCKKTCAPWKHVPALYARRYEVGKNSGPGTALKLGINAGYGKTAQTKGANPPYQDWVWAGVTTANCRGQVLRAIAKAKNRWDIISIATDGIVSIEKLNLDRPKDTGTSSLEKPLGGWEHEEHNDGYFIAKPGMYWGLKADKKEKVKARGVGAETIFTNKDRIEQGFMKWDGEADHPITVSQKRFYGAKQSMYAAVTCLSCKKTYPGTSDTPCPSCKKTSNLRWSVCPLIYDLCEKCKKRWSTKKDRDQILRDRRFVASICNERVVIDQRTTLCEHRGNRGSCGLPRYGTWSKTNTDIRFDPWPKRERRFVKGDLENVRLHVRDLEGATSTPYSKGMISPHGKASAEAKEIALEQPDWHDGKLDDEEDGQ